MKLIFLFEFYKFIEVLGIDFFDKIFFVIFDWVLVIDRYNLILINIKGDIFYYIYLRDVCGLIKDFCFVKNGNELVYIDGNLIKKLLNYMKIIIIFIKKIDFIWKL